MTPDAEGFTFVVLGRAAPQGSKALHTKADGSKFMKEASDNVKPWRRKIVRAAMGSDGRPMATFKGPVEIHIEFEFRRAKSNTDDFPTGQNIGDGDKLTRAVWDALTQAKVIEDDAYCVDWSGSKRWAEEDRAYITVRNPRGYSPDVLPGPPAQGSIVDFAQQIGVTLEPWQIKPIGPEDVEQLHFDMAMPPDPLLPEMPYRVPKISPSCCNTVDHKSCNMMGTDNCPCPDHCTA
jgi:crossover junction endodeoxyribonuclease RusA